MFSTSSIVESYPSRKIKVLIRYFYLFLCFLMLLPIWLTVDNSLLLFPTGWASQGGLEVPLSNTDNQPVPSQSPKKLTKCKLFIYILCYHINNQLHSDKFRKELLCSFASYCPGKYFISNELKWKLYLAFLIMEKIE